VADKFSIATDMLSAMTQRSGVNSRWLTEALQAGKITPDMPGDEIHRIVAQMSGRLPAPSGPAPTGQADAAPDIRSLIRYGTSGPGVPVQPPLNTGYTPGMQGTALANGVENMGLGPRVSQQAGGLIPSPVDPRKFTMGDVPPGTGYTPEMIAEAYRRGVEIPMPRQQAAPVDVGMRGLPGPVASPEQLAQIERARRMYGSAAGRTDDILAGADPNTGMILFGSGGPSGRGIPIGEGSRGMITQPTFADEMRGMASRGFHHLGGAELAAAGGLVGGAYAVSGSDMGDPEGPPRPYSVPSMGRTPGSPMPPAPMPAITDTSGTADLAAESRPVPEVEPTPNPVPPPQRPITDLSPEKQQTVGVMVKAGIPPERAQEIVRGKYSLSPQERGMLIRSGRQ